MAQEQQSHYFSVTAYQGTVVDDDDMRIVLLHAEQTVVDEKVRVRSNQLYSTVAIPPMPFIGAIYAIAEAGRHSDSSKRKVRLSRAVVVNDHRTDCLAL
jgi:hypothetical protein